MFERYFAVECIARRGTALVALKDEADTVIVLNHLPKKAAEFAYPDDFHVMHIGFHQEQRETVDAVHGRLVADGWDVQTPRDFHGAWTFYFKAPGGYFIEVYHQYRLG